MSKKRIDPDDVPRRLARWRDEFLYFVGIDRFMKMVHDLSGLGRA